MRSAFLFALLLGVLSLHAQTIPLRHFTDEDGLVSNTIYSLSRDSHGYLWLCSDKGIGRFNGIEFKNFTTADGLPDNEVFNITEDMEGRLWLCCFNGAFCYYKDGRFFTAVNTPWLKLPFKLPVLRSFAHSDGSVSFILSDNSKFVNVLHNTVRVYKTLMDAESIFGKKTLLLAVKKLSSGKYRLIYRRGTADIDTNGKASNINIYPDNREFHYLDGDIIAKLPDHNLAADGIYSMNGKLLFPINAKLNFDYSVAVKVQGKNYFVGLLNGLLINDSFKIPSDTHVSGIMDDTTSNVWFATVGDGIYNFDKEFRFQHTFKNAYTGKILHAKVKNGNVLFTNNDGTLYGISNHEFRKIYSNPDHSTGDNHFLVPGNFLINDSLDFILLDGEKGLIIQKADKSITRTKTFLFSIVSAKELFQDRDRLIATSSHALISLDYPSLLKNGVVKESKFNIRPKAGDQRIYGRSVDPQTHSLWFSQEKVLFELRDGLQIEKPAFKNMTLRQITFFKNHMVGLTDDNKLLITRSYDDKAPPLEILAKDCIWSHIYQLDQTHAIISTNNYYRLLTVDGSYRNPRPDYTVQTIEDPFIPLRAEWIAGDSINCFFFKNGSVVQMATRLLFNKIKPPLSVISVIKTRTQTYPPAKEINIPYGESQNINIAFDNISFTSKEITCQYSISTNDKDDWREITGNEINLNSPGYGTFNIKIRSKTLSSGYSRPAILIIHVEKPYWATWWFITISALVLLGFIWCVILFITWRRLRKKQKEHDADMKYQQSEYKALNALMNPHFIFNSLNNIQGLINKDEKRTANQFLVIFSDLIRQNMHNISKGFISLQQELTLIENYLTLEKLRFKELVNYEIVIDEEVEIEDIMIPPLMIQPLVENAVKHGLLPKQSADAKVWIRVFEKDDLLYIVIEDNGIGLTASLKNHNKLHESFGLSNLKKRTEHLKKIQEQKIDIEVTELKNAHGTITGTQAIVTIEIN
jgi:hypothetical protein